MKIEDFIPELWALNRDLESAFSRYRFLWNTDQSEVYRIKYEELKRKKELLLKPIFGL